MICLSAPIHPVNAARSRLNEATASTLLSQLAFGSDTVKGVPYALRRDVRRKPWEVMGSEMPSDGR
jgi:hypothetical protein